jgi:TATA-box binding protein (TBP) (component of TFIID and TFIIIB)
MLKGVRPPVPPLINNIKIRFSVQQPDLDQLGGSIKLLSERTQFLTTVRGKPVFKNHHNFLVFRHTYVYIVFFHSGTVNVTGVRRHEEISEAVFLFCQEFRVDRQGVSRVTVDNITATGDLCKEVNLRLLKRSINAVQQQQENSLLQFTASYNLSHFPACFLRSEKGTVLLFSSGRFNIVGSKCRRDVNKVYQGLLAHMMSK